MKLHLTKFERTAGLFVGLAAVGFCVLSVGVAIKQGWFSAKRHYNTTFSQGEGLHSGTMVQIAGLRAGVIEDVAINDDNRIAVTIKINNEFVKRIKKDSLARVIRPFIIGDKVVEVTVGSNDMPVLPEGATLISEDTMDIMDFMGGKKLGPFLNTFDSLLKNLQVVAEAFSDRKRTEALIAMFDEALPTLKDIRELSRQMTVNKNLKVTMKNLTSLTSDMHEMLPSMVKFSENLPELGSSTTETMKQLTILTTEVNKIMPIIAEIAPKLPDASQKGVDALKEAVVVLKAMQKSFLLRGAVSDVKEEEAIAAKEQKKKEKEESERMPASEPVKKDKHMEELVE